MHTTTAQVRLGGIQEKCGEGGGLLIVMHKVEINKRKLIFCMGGESGPERSAYMYVKIECCVSVCLRQRMVQQGGFRKKRDSGIVSNSSTVTLLI